MRYRLRTIAIFVALTWLVAVLAALVGQLLSSPHAATSNNLWFALGWGTTFGLIPAGFTAALLSEDRFSVAPQKWLPIVWLALAVASAGSLYVFTVTTASV